MLITNYVIEYQIVDWYTLLKHRKIAVCLCDPKGWFTHDRIFAGWHAIQPSKHTTLIQRPSDVYNVQMTRRIDVKTTSCVSREGRFPVSV